MVTSGQVAHRTCCASGRRCRGGCCCWQRGKADLCRGCSLPFRDELAGWCQWQLKAMERWQARDRQPLWLCDTALWRDGGSGDLQCRLWLPMGHLWERSRRRCGMEVAVSARCRARAGPGPEAAAGQRQPGRAGFQLCSLPLHHCCAWAVAAPGPPQMEAWCQAWLSLPQGFPQLPLQPVPPCLSLTCCHCSSSSCPSRGFL